jgi:hypothetical protein
MQKDFQLCGRMSDVVLRGKHLTDLVYVTGTRQVLTHVHDPSACAEQDHCVIHNPSGHPLVNAPTHWRVQEVVGEEDVELIQIMQRICSHGVFHPDLDDLIFIAETKGPLAASRAKHHECCEGECCGVRT